MKRNDSTANNRKVAARPWIVFAVVLAAALLMAVSSGGGEGRESELAVASHPISVGELPVV